MKKLIVFVMALALLALPSYALQKQVTSVSGTSSTIFSPGQNCAWVTIQNNGSGNVRLTFDGSATPTSSTGYLLVAGAQITVAYGSGQKNIIKAILVDATTTTLDISTSDSSGSS